MVLSIVRMNFFFWVLLALLLRLPSADTDQHVSTSVVVPHAHCASLQILMAAAYHSFNLCYAPFFVIYCHFLRSFASHQTSKRVALVFVCEWISLFLVVRCTLFNLRTLIHSMLLLRTCILQLLCKH